MKTWIHKGDASVPEWADPLDFSGPRDYEFPELQGMVAIQVHAFSVVLVPREFAGTVYMVESSSDVAGDPIFSFKAYPAELTDAGRALLENARGGR